MAGEYVGFQGQNRTGQEPVQTDEDQQRRQFYFLFLVAFGLFGVGFQHNSSTIPAQLVFERSEIQSS